MAEIHITRNALDFSLEPAHKRPNKTAFCTFALSCLKHITFILVYGVGDNANIAHCVYSNKYMHKCAPTHTDSAFLHLSTGAIHQLQQQPQSLRDSFPF